jgi:hypothetical protein
MARWIANSMHPHQTSMPAGADPLLGMLPTLARRPIARLFFDSEDGDPAAQIASSPPTSRRCPPSRPSGQGEDPRPPTPRRRRRGGQLPGWTAGQADLAALSSTSDHRTIAGATHASLIDDETPARRSSQAIRDIVLAGPLSTKAPWREGASV